MINVIVRKSISRSYGYTLQWVGPNCPGWVVGPSQTWAWFRYKRDAIEHLRQCGYNV